MPIAALPPLKVAADEVYPPPLTVTEPVGVPLLPDTETVTVSAWAVVILEEEGVTNTVGVVLPALGVIKLRILPFLGPVLFDA
jgi:hypothetical protein